VENEYWDDIKIHVKSCAEFMMDKINAQISLINFDDPDTVIKLAEEPFLGNYLFH